MQKHQEWLENRSYEQHLKHLRSIKRLKSKTHVSSKSMLLKTSRLSPERITQLSPQHKLHNRILNNNIKNHEGIIETIEENKQNNQQKIKIIFDENNQRRKRIKILSSRLNDQGINNFMRFNNGNSLQEQTKLQINKITKEKHHKTISLKQQEILWQNYLLGKRLVETAPVICKKKLDEDYKKHAELVRVSTLIKVQHKSRSNFRLQKLKQHNNIVQRLTDDYRIENSKCLNRYIIHLIIQNIEIFKYKVPEFENIMVSMKCGKKNLEDSLQTGDKLYHTMQNYHLQKNKNNKQTSECIPSGLLTSYNFYFKYNKAKFNTNTPIVIELSNVKSLKSYPIGTFCFEFNQQKHIDKKQVTLFNFGKPVGEVRFNAQFGKKETFISNPCD